MNSRLQVYVQGRGWVFNPLCLEPAPGETAPYTPDPQSIVQLLGGACILSNYFFSPNLVPWLSSACKLFWRFFNRCFHCVISAQKEHPESGIRCTSACGWFRVWLHFTSPGDSLQMQRLPLVAICSAWRADQVLYGSCTFGIYSDDIVLCVFLVLDVEADREIQRSTVALSSFVSALAIHIRK